MEFWKYLYEELGSVFVSGVPSGVFGTLINTMDSSYMHFVPAVNDEVAIGLCIGAFTAGIKACVLVEKNNLVLLKEKIKRMKYVLNYAIIIITNEDINFLNLKHFKFKFVGLNDYVYKDNNSAIVVL